MGGFDDDRELIELDQHIMNAGGAHLACVFYNRARRLPSYFPV
jgi:hypothetical protein